MADMKELAAASKQLLDTHAFNVVLEYLEGEAVNTLTAGTLEKAENNLRNLRAMQLVRMAVANLSNADAVRDTYEEH